MTKSVGLLTSPRNRRHTPPPPVDEAPSRSQSMNDRPASDCAPRLH